jgi:crotonobetainyl-CoA:carnitine CoA-transferase CaiB-like acyl-CoA transferase
MSGRVLEGVRILDLTRVVAGPFATAVLADLGADVIKIERPRTGDDYRYGPSTPGETSLSFQNTNRGKRSITLDVRKDEGRELFLRLVESGADAVVENFRAGWMDARGLAPEVIQARNPRCLVASLSGFGRTGWRAGQASYDIVAQATGGLMALTGFPDGPPVRGGGALGDFVGGLYLALGIVAGLLERDRTGRARALDLSNQDALFAIADSSLTIWKGIGESMERVGNQHPFTAPYDCFATRDGHVVIASASNRLFRRLCEGIGRPELAEDERYRHHRVRAQNRVELNGIFADWSAERTCDEVIARLGPDGVGVPVARVERPEDLAEDTQLIAREMIERHPHPSIGEVWFHGNPLKYDGADPREIPLAPELAADNEAVYGALGVSSDELRRLEEEGVV